MWIKGALGILEQDILRNITTFLNNECGGDLKYLFDRFDSEGEGELSQSDLVDLFKTVMPNIENQNSAIRHILILFA